MTSATDGIAGGCVNAACQIVGVTTIYPDRVKPGTSEAERKLHAALQRLSDEWTVFHSGALASQPKWQPFHGEAAPLQSWRHLNCQMSFDPKPVATEVSVVGADRLHGPVRPRARDR